MSIQNSQNQVALAHVAESGVAGLDAGALVSCDRETVTQLLNYLHEPGDVREIRGIYKGGGLRSVYFDDPAKVVDEIPKFADAMGTFITINPVKPELLGRAPNEIILARKGGCTKDTDIVERRFLPVDLDPARPSGVSATEEERTATMHVAMQMVDHLSELEFPPPLIANSGNGVHLLFRVNLPADDQGLTKRFLLRLHELFSDNRVKVDTGVHNPARIFRVYGTMARKGEDTPERPHRMATIVDKPVGFKVVTVEQLEQVANQSTVASQLTLNQEESTNRYHKGRVYLDGVNFEALEAMLNILPKESEADGSSRLIRLARVAVRHDLSDESAIDTIRKYEETFPFQVILSEADILRRVRDAEKTNVRGAGVVISNARIANMTVGFAENGDLRIKKFYTPLFLNEIIESIHLRTDDWPRRVDQMLFVDGAHGIDYFDRRTTASLFGWLQSLRRVDWKPGSPYVAKAELFAEMERTALRYDGIELYPHVPEISNLYYRCEQPKPGDGSHLSNLLDRFRPETTVDRDLIQAALMTPLWGGPAGCRPAFVVTSDDGRGVGKSKVAEVAGYLYGGHVDVSANEDISKLKTRLLTPSARTKRVALIDNIKSLKLSWAELEAFITSPVISGHQMYIGEGQRPNLLTWFLTLNGVSMSTDMAQRSVIIKVVKGDNSGTWWEDTRKYIDDFRQEIMSDLFACLRSDRRPPSKYSRWATWEEHVLSRLPDPKEAQRLILERQNEANTELEEAEIIERQFADRLIVLGFDPDTCQVRIPVSKAAEWYSDAMGVPTKTAHSSRRLKQMASEGQLTCIAPDPSRKNGRSFIWTGRDANVFGDKIMNLDSLIPA